MTDDELDLAIRQSQDKQTQKYKEYREAVYTTDKLKMMKRVNRIKLALSEGKPVDIYYHGKRRVVTNVEMPEKIINPSGEVSNNINVTYLDDDGKEKIAKIDYHNVGWD